MQTFSYRNAPSSVKLAATFFFLFAVVGLGIAGLQIYVRTGLTTQGALAHYRGDEATLQYPMSFNEMVEVAHAHAFTMPLIVLTLSLGIAVSEAPDGLKRFVVIALFSGVAMELGLPWLVRYGPSWAVHLFGLAGVLLGWRPSRGRRCSPVRDVDRDRLILSSILRRFMMSDRLLCRQDRVAHRCVRNLFTRL